MGKRIVIHPILAALICSTVIAISHIIVNLIRKGEMDLVQSVVMGITTGTTTTFVISWMNGKSSDSK